MNLKNQIESDLHEAMRNNNELKKNTLRMLLASLKLFEIEKHSTLSDQEILTSIQKEIKMRNETISEVQATSRNDLVEKAKQEIEILQKYLPIQLSDNELQLLVHETIKETGATTLKEMGVVMKSLLPKINGRATTDRVSNAVRNALS